MVMISFFANRASERFAMRRSRPCARFGGTCIMPEKKPHAEAHGSENQEVIIKIKLSDITEKKKVAAILQQPFG